MASTDKEKRINFIESHHLFTLESSFTLQSMSSMHAVASSRVSWPATVANEKFIFCFLFLRRKHVLLSCMQVMFVDVLNRHFPSVQTQLLLRKQFHGRVINTSEWSLCTLSLLLRVWIMCHETKYTWSPVKSYSFWFSQVWSWSLLTNSFNRPTYHSLG